MAQLGAGLGSDLGKTSIEYPNAFSQNTCVIFVIRGVCPIVHGCHVPQAEGRDEYIPLCT